jgi:exosome complex RNA-binding protein Rrp4
MAIIRATFKRVIRLREYENETIELTVEQSHDEINDGDAVKHGVVSLFRQLSEQADTLVAERLGTMRPGQVIDLERGAADPRLFTFKSPQSTPESAVMEPDDFIGQ